MKQYKMVLADTHSHLYDEAFDGDRDSAVQRALEAGVGKIFLPAIDSETHEVLFGMCEKYPDVCYPMIGLHPTSINDNPEYRDELSLVGQLLENPPQSIGGKFYAVGEIGLDLYWSEKYYEQQLDAFEKQISLSLEYGLPLVIHTRSAWNEMVGTLSKYKGTGIRGIMHSFSGSYADYQAIKRCGDFLFGIGGVVTYKKSEIADILPRMPLEDIVLETDCPYLTPVPFRGKRNESSYVKYVCQKVAEIKGLPVGHVAEVTTENAMRIFGLDG